MPLRAKLYGGRTYGRIALVYACDADLFVLVSYGHYDYAQVNNFQQSTLGGILDLGQIGFSTSTVWAQTGTTPHIRYFHSGSYLR